MDNKIIYPKEQSIEHIGSKARTSLLLTSKVVAFGVINASTGELWGPFKAEVYVWEG
jgi:hypothetical protein